MHVFLILANLKIASTFLTFELNTPWRLSYKFNSHYRTKKVITQIEESYNLRHV